MQTVNKQASVNALSEKRQWRKRSSTLRDFFVISIKELSVIKNPYPLDQSFNDYSRQQINGE
jgi:hypothetical protein